MKISYLIFSGIIFVLALLYIVWPIDLIPDVIPVVGWIDDGIVAITGLSGTLFMLYKTFFGE